MKNKQPKFELEPEIAPEKTTTINFNCPTSIRDEIKRLAIEQDRTLGKQVVRILRLWLLSRGSPKAEGYRTDD